MARKGKVKKVVYLLDNGTEKQNDTPDVCLRQN